MSSVKTTRKSNTLTKPAAAAKSKVAVVQLPQIQYVGIAPTTKLITSTRKAGYDNYAALADIVDNSLEPRVGATTVRININVSRLITITDDGIGMDYAEFVESMRMGARNHAGGKDGKGVLGGFGLGMKTAGTSLGKRLTVMTRKAGNPLYVAEYDTDDIDERGEYVIPLNEANETQLEEFEFLTEGSATGTVVMISKLDQVKTNSTGQFVRTLRRRLGEIFRHYLHTKTILVNKLKVEPVDIMMENAGSVLHYHSAHLLKFQQGGQEKTAAIRVKLFILPDITSKARDEDDQEYRLNMPNQGLYFMRNDRQIIRAELLNITARDPYNNRFRGEVYIDGDLDEALGLNFMKNNIASRSESVQNKLKAIIRPQFLEIRRIIDRERAKKHETDEARQEENEKIASEINSHWKELGLLDKVERKESTPREKENKELEKEIQQRQQRQSDPNRPQGDQNPRAVIEIRALALGADGNIVEYTDKGNGAMIMTWNTEHAYYDKFVAEASVETYKALVNLFVAQGRQQFKTLLSGELTTETKAMLEAKLNDYHQEVAKEVTILM
jgi:hypothetical protein